MVICIVRQTLMCSADDEPHHALWPHLLMIAPYNYMLLITWLRVVVIKELVK